MHGLVAQDVLVLLSSPRHFVLTTQRQDLGETNVEEQAFHQTSKHNQTFEQGLICLCCAGMKTRVHDGFDKGDQELVFVTDRFDLVVGAENLTLIESERL